MIELNPLSLINVYFVGHHIGLDHQLYKNNLPFDVKWESFYTNFVSVNGQSKESKVMSFRTTPKNFEKAYRYLHDHFAILKDKGEILSFEFEGCKKSYDIVD